MIINIHSTTVDVYQQVVLQLAYNIMQVQQIHCAYFGRRHRAQWHSFNCLRKNKLNVCTNSFL
jgi:hypothetical protein